MAGALKQTASQRTRHNRNYQNLRDRLIEHALTIPGVQLTGHPTERLPNHTSFVFEGVDGNQLLAALDLRGYGCSSGSACKTGDPTPSDVLLSLGLPNGLALGSLRVTVGRSNTSEQIEQFSRALRETIARLRATEDAG
jgi:cysteine desulfurase